MGTARQDFERFVRWLHEPEQRASDQARRFANLVLAHFDAIRNTSRQRNQRSALLAFLARRELAATAPDIPVLADAAPDGDWPWVRLRSLTVGPFRGFRNPQPFDLHKRLVLFYGPNGSGKTSVCEALEYALLGVVEEADAKRIEPAAYLANLHARQFARPVLKASDAAGREVDVGPNADAFRFCFVEKNRIDAFSRIAARPPARRGELIAALFGMDQFNDFASHFNESMEPALVLGTQTQMMLTERRRALAADIALSGREAARLAELDTVATEYAAAFSDGLDFARLSMLVGTQEAPGRLQELEAQIDVIPPDFVGVRRERLLELYRSLDAGAENLSASNRALDERRTQISFRDLYTSVLALQSDDSDHCPACKTPVAQVVENPFDRARAGIADLAELASLEAEHERHAQAQLDSDRALRMELQRLRAFLEEQGEGRRRVGAYINSIEHNVQGANWWRGVHSPEEDETGATPALEEILAAADRVQQRDEHSEASRRQRHALIQERDRLNVARLWIHDHELLRDRVVADAAAARARIDQFEQTNANLIARARQEGEDNLRDRPINAAYDSFMPLLRRFRERLPAMLMADLNQVAMELYNDFNRDDLEEDKLADLKLPVTADGRIDVVFRGNPARSVDALAILSDGHVRCLGLAILLAKALAVRAPVIVFDDAINAIDHDHRGGIRAAVFESDRFRDTQIVVTCHSHEFIKDVQNHLQHDQREDCQEYLLLHHLGDHQPRVNPDVGSSNYLAKAQEALARLDARDALSYGRKALEMLTRKAWKWLESHRHGDLSLQVEGPEKEPQLRVLCEALRRKLLDLRTFDHPSKTPLVEALNTILGIPAENLVWRYLNKGTHEEADREDFDRQHVQTVLTTLEAMDRLELRRGR